MMLISFLNKAMNLFWCECVQACVCVCVCLPVDEAFALQVGQCRAELVGKQNERGQVEIVLPHLKERPQLQTDRKMGHKYAELHFEGLKVKTMESVQKKLIFGVAFLKPATTTNKKQKPLKHAPLQECTAPWWSTLGSLWSLRSA